MKVHFSFLHEDPLFGSPITHWWDGAFCGQNGGDMVFTDNVEEVDCKKCLRCMLTQHKTNKNNLDSMEML